MKAKQSQGSSAQKALSGAKKVAAVKRKPKTIKKVVSREELYKVIFVAPQTFLGPDEFMPQVNGYGTPTFGAVGSFAGV